MEINGNHDFKETAIKRIVELKEKISALERVATYTLPMQMFKIHLK